MMANGVQLLRLPHGRATQICYTLSIHTNCTVSGCALTANNLHLWSHRTLKPNSHAQTNTRTSPIIIKQWIFGCGNLLFLYITDYNEETSNRLIYDEERKYGKIPAKIYLLYLKSCGFWTIGTFCASALAWQATKIYLDVWLRDWTDVEQTNRFTDVRTNQIYIYIYIQNYFIAMWYDTMRYDGWLLKSERNMATATTSKLFV